MFGFIFIFFIGRFFYRLAEQYHQNKWLFGILGVVMYYAGTLFAGVCVGLIMLIFDWDIDTNEGTITLIAIPFGIGACWLFHYLLEKHWKSKKVEPIENIDDIGKDIDEIGV
ncbi:hypothetical protein [Flavobacterium sp. NRK F7]|uniref:hypothetical protein n=1 Tax=Flavobacterium sp. NRK F7 TaxID=2954930 RepID=UPI00209190E9|nr:hypothetical protein [Flavobacterium sp. NRK F7]MCO6162639.1 hypothetical protein [Flavobacterium sp. NRK F7]